MKVYVAGAWVEQHERARPMIAELRAAGIEITHDWTRAEGEVIRNAAGGVVQSDADLDVEDRKRHALEDLRGVLAADVVWLLAPNDKGACGAWVELGAALALRGAWDPNPARAASYTPRIIVSGPKARRSIFTELAETYDTDEAAFAVIVAADRGLVDCSPTFDAMRRAKAK